MDIGISDIGHFTRIGRSLIIGYTANNKTVPDVKKVWLDNLERERFFQ